MEQPYTRYEKLNEQPIYRTWQLRATGLLRQQLVEALSEEILLGQGKTLLLVDDEPQVREMIQTWLECLHYRVLTAANGKEALVVYEQHSDAIALVLTDLVMPDDGRGRAMPSPTAAEPSCQNPRHDSLSAGGRRPGPI